MEINNGVKVSRTFYIRPELELVDLHVDNIIIASCDDDNDVCDTWDNTP